MSQSPPTILAISKALTQRHGVSVIPVDSDKHPALKDAEGKSLSWKPYQSARMTSDEVAHYFQHADRIALICGHVSGDLEVLDFDVPGFFERWQSVLIDNGHEELLNSLVRQRTPSGGFHIIYRATNKESNQKLARRYKEDGKPEIAIETRGEGGYIVAYPSPGYEMVHRKLSEIPTISAEDRDALIYAAKLLDEVAEDVRNPQPVANGVAGKRPGDEFNERSTWSEVLEPHGWERIGCVGPRELWRRPGKTGKHTSATTGNGWGKDLLKVFTSNAYPLEVDGVYSKFYAYAILNHGGDPAQAASQLAKEGYGEKREQPPQVIGPVTEAATDAPARRFRLYSLDELLAMPPKPMLVKGLLGVQDRWMLFGPPGCGKSFSAVDLMVAMASGTTWACTFDPVKPLKVLYCTGEGKFGMPRRLAANLNWNAITHDSVKDNIRMILDVPQLFNLNHDRSILVMAKEITEDGWVPDVVILDTLNKAALGSKETDNSDAAIVCDTVAQVGELLGCSTGLVHHQGWVGDNPRGASAYHGDMDMIIRQSLDQNQKTGEIHCYKSKDVPPFSPLAFAITGHDGSAVVDWRRSGFEAGDDTISIVLLVMKQNPDREWWTPTELKQGYMPHHNADTIRKACKRESQSLTGLIYWDGKDLPPRYKLKNFGKDNRTTTGQQPDRLFGGENA